ncbi:hypothetical protein PtA15_2A138 [Puccinia triticina]|uniref:Uncharacterized protein n=1 Tax=Puccinia triticina TaxID=208348 RepID=A0ABY7C9G8_9BASI|nr:uncharacterized protein PtA15_2A138 [Puccinia triticina]WAQ81826.1 hypothetical protein PtA15_2A138 [Puccinia triticina]
MLRNPARDIYPCRPGPADPAKISSQPLSFGYPTTSAEMLILGASKSILTIEP